MLKTHFSFMKMSHDHYPMKKGKTINSEYDIHTGSYIAQPIAASRVHVLLSLT